MRAIAEALAGAPAPDPDFANDTTTTPGTGLRDVIRVNVGEDRPFPIEDPHMFVADSKAYGTVRQLGGRGH